MKSKTFYDFKTLPTAAGIFSLLNSSGQSLLISVAENVKAQSLNFLRNYETLNLETEKIEVFDKMNLDLINVFSKLVRRKKPIYNFLPDEQNTNPYLKITNEKFPRLLATRRIEDDNAEYFGAFLPATSVRFLLGFLIDTFNLRGCDIPIDGSLPVPCPQFYRRKCLAPCVENLCDYEKYNESVNLVRLFLKNKRETINKIFSEEIEVFSAAMEYEKARERHRLLTGLNDFWSEKDGNFSFEDTADSFEIKPTETGFLIYTATRRNRRILGRKVFVYENKAGFSAKEVLAQMLWQFYPFYAPKEISVSIDFPTRKLLAETLSSRDDRSIKIQTVKKEKQTKTAVRALRRAAVEFELENLKPKMPVGEICEQLRREFSLLKNPSIIEAYDIAHISETDFVGAKTVWKLGKFIAEEYQFWFLNERTELDALSKTLENRFSDGRQLPDLILIDGGKAQLLRAVKAKNQFSKTGVAIVSAVKPPRRHNDISHFLLENEHLLRYRDCDYFRVLLHLRDEAHRLANYVHRTKRETRHFYEIFRVLSFLPENERYLLVRRFRSLRELKNTPEADLIDFLGADKGKLVYLKLKKQVTAPVEPFIVPIKYDELNGSAEDLQPLFAKEKNRR